MVKSLSFCFKMRDCPSKQRTVGKSVCYHLFSHEAQGQSVQSSLTVGMGFLCSHVPSHSQEIGGSNFDFNQHFSASITFRIGEMDNWLNLNKRPCWDSIHDPFACKAHPWTTDYATKLLALTMHWHGYHAKVSYKPHPSRWFQMSYKAYSRRWFKGVLHPGTLFLKTLQIFSKNKATLDNVFNGSD